jgi:hypothetical protein
MLTPFGKSFARELSRGQTSDMELSMMATSQAECDQDAIDQPEIIGGKGTYQ